MLTSKIDLGPLLNAQIKSFKGYRWQATFRDVGIFVALPIALGAAVLWAQPKVYNAGSGIAGVSVLTGLLFALLVNVFNLAVKMRRDEGLTPESLILGTVDELLANVGWSVLVGLALVVTLACGVSTQQPNHELGRWWVAVIVVMFAHLLVTVLMALSRIFSAHAQIAELAPPMRK